MAVTYVLDTSAYSLFARGELRFGGILEPENRIIVPWIVVGELKSGFLYGVRYDDNMTKLQKFLDIPNVEIVGIDGHTASLFAEISVALKRSGKPIGSNDVWIAACTFQYDAELVTSDNDFSRIPGLRLYSA